MRDEPGRLIETVLAPGIVRWTISHPRKRNALTPAMLAAIEAGARALRGEIVVLDAAAGPCFCAGFDLDALPEGQVDAPTADAPDAPLITASAALQTCDALVVAVVHGEVFGAGVELVAACDVRLAAPGVRFTVPAARLGVVYHAAGVALLRRVFGPALARRMLLAADGITAEEAHRDLLRALDRGGPSAEELAAHERARRVAYTSDDFREGRAAARERRSPRFRGG
jgi:enoyl-CoA hydratase/carnithine racemase